MSKKVNVNETATNATAEVVTLQSLFEKYPNASIRKLAAATDINYGVLLKKSKEPVLGEVYDPEATNWAALEAKLADKKVDFTTLDWEAMNAGVIRKGANLQKDMDAFPVGSKVYLRKNNATPYEVVYKTETHIVIQLEGTQEPIAWAHNTFLINGPVFEPRAEKVTANDTEDKKEGEEA